MKVFIAAALAAIATAQTVDPLKEETVYSEALGHDNGCEHAIGHDGHYDDNNVWILDDDMDYEPEWRCLMRPYLIKSTAQVAQGQISIEAKTVEAEKLRLIEVHERLVREAADNLKKQQC